MSNNELKIDPAAAAQQAAALARAAKGLPALDEPTHQHTDDGPLPEGVTQLVLFTVTIGRNEVTKVPTQVFQHELPILYHIYGEDLIEVVESRTQYVQVENFDVDNEFDRLQRKYDRSDAGREAIKQVYGQGSYRLAEELGIRSERPRGAFTKRNQARSLEIDHSVDNPLETQQKAARILPSKTLRTSNAAGVKPRETRAVTAAKAASSARAAATDGDNGGKAASKPAKPKAKPAAKPKSGKAEASK